jgi:hypothetical protein
MAKPSRSGPLSAITLLRRARQRAGIAEGGRPRIVRVSPSRARPGSTIHVQCEPAGKPTVWLRTAHTVHRLGSAADALKLPDIPSARAALLVSLDQGISRPAWIEILAGPVVHRVAAMERDRWQVTGEGLSTEGVLVEIRGQQISPVVVSDTELVFEAQLVPRTPVQVVVGEQRSNVVAAEDRRGLAVQ